MRRIATLLAATWMCTACVGSALRSDAAPPDRYRLNGPQTEPAGATLPLAVAVARPRAPSSLDTDRIAVALPGHGFDYLAGARWSDAAPQMLQQLLVAALSGDRHFATVVAAPSRVPADVLLDVELRRFEAEYADAHAAPKVVVVLGVNVVDARRGTRIASFESAASAQAAQNGRAAILAAFELATDEVIRDSAARIAAAVPRP